MANIGIIVVAAVYGIAVACFLKQLTQRVVEYKQSQRERKVIAETDKVGLIAAGAVHALLCIAAAIVLPMILVVPTCLLITCGVVGSLVDNELRIIPNELVIAVLAIGVVYRLLEGGPISLLTGFGCTVGVTCIFAVSMFITKKLKGQIGVGAGDLKLAMVASFIAGYPAVLVFLLGMVFSMLAYFAAKLLRGSFSFVSYFPMCAFIMTGLAVGVICPHVPGLSNYMGGVV